MPCTTPCRRSCGPICTRRSPTGSNARPVRRRAGRVRRVPPRAGIPIPRGARSGRRRRDARSPLVPADDLLAAGERALGRGDVAAAERLLGRAMALLPADDPRCALGHAVLGTGAVLQRSARANARVPRRGGRPGRATRAPTRSAPASRSIARWSEPTSARSSRCDPALDGDREPHGVAGGRRRRPRPGRRVVDRRGLPILARRRRGSRWRPSNAAHAYAERAGIRAAHPAHLQRTARPVRLGTRPQRRGRRTGERAHRARWRPREAIPSSSIAVARGRPCDAGRDRPRGRAFRSIPARARANSVSDCISRRRIHSSRRGCSSAATRRRSAWREGHRAAPCDGRARIPRDVVDLPGRRDRVAGSARRGRGDPEGGRGARGRG